MQPYEKNCLHWFAKRQTLHCHLHVAKGSTVQFHAQEVIWEIGNFTLTGGLGCRFECVAGCVAGFPVSSNVLEEQQSAGEVPEMLERFLLFFRYLRSPDHLADQFRSAA